jgi:ABC-type spermidine/putrescine transport system permease subunit II
MAREISRSGPAAVVGMAMGTGPAARPRQGTGARYLLASFGGAVLLFLCLPIAVVVPMSFSSASSLEFPPPGLSLRWYQSFFGDPRWLRAAGNSALIALASSVAALVLGSIAAYGLVRGSFRGRALLEGNFIAPLILPPVITAVALYIFFARIGLLGTIPGLIVAHTVLTVPYDVGDGMVQRLRFSGRF